MKPIHILLAVYLTAVSGLALSPLLILVQVANDWKRHEELRVVQ